MTAEVVTATVRIAAPPAIVFSYFTDPVLIVQWIGEWADLIPEPGGPSPSTSTRLLCAVRYVEIDPPRRVVLTWGVAGKDSLPSGSTTVEVVLTPDGPETVVELFHHDLPPADFPGHLEGWNAMLAKLMQHWAVSG